MSLFLERFCTYIWCFLETQRPSKKPAFVFSPSPCSSLFFPLWGPLAAAPTSSPWRTPIGHATFPDQVQTTQITAWTMDLWAFRVQIAVIQLPPRVPIMLEQKLKFMPWHRLPQKNTLYLKSSFSALQRGRSPCNISFLCFPCRCWTCDVNGIMNAKRPL